MRLAVELGRHHQQRGVHDEGAVHDAGAPALLEPQAGKIRRLEIVKGPFVVQARPEARLTPLEGRRVTPVGRRQRQALALRDPPQRRGEPTATPFLRQQAVDPVGHAARGAAEDDQMPADRPDQELLGPKDSLSTSRPSRSRWRLKPTKILVSPRAWSSPTSGSSAPVISLT